ncbi:MAG: leucyl aminopeptidase [Longimicrobiales bacterium]
MHEPTIQTTQVRATDLTTPLLVLHAFERDKKPVGFLQKVDAMYAGAITRVLESDDFKGKRDETLVLYAPSKDAAIQRVLLVGVGKKQDHTVESVRRGVGTAIRVAERMGITQLAISVGHVHHLSERMGNYNAGLAAVQAALLAAWDFREYKSKNEDSPPTALVEDITILAFDDVELREYKRAVDYGRITARATNFARELQTQPGNVATPTYLANAAKKMADENGLACTILDLKAIKKEGMKALLAVSQGSEEEPRFIILEHKGGGDSKPVVLIGKGVTFDSGGVSIKPADRMEEMKYDMSGAAAVIAAMQGIAQLGLKINVVGLIPSTENLPDGKAFKPGDVIGSHLGKTIEIVNTDAEGRLILADALSYARRFDPVAMVDAATLTGAVVIALGFHAIGLMGTDGDLMDEVKVAGVRVGERCWPLPLWDEYRPQIDSTIADMKNSGGRAAGSITAGWFLKEFAGDVPWVHLDIAGTAYKDEAAPYLRKGATGLPTRLFIEWVRARAEA